MKLRNKKTGKIGNLVLNINPNRESYTVLSTENGDTICGNLVVGDYDTLAELNEDWEDYEEPNRYWYIDIDGEILDDKDEDTDTDKNKKYIGNYFETEEEAEKAVEKLKAWKRLKDAGAEFYGWQRNQSGTYELYMRWEDRIPRSYEVKNDLDLLFGGEE